MKTTIVTTTINIPTFINEYEEKLKNDSNVFIIIVGDSKTPELAEQYVKDKGYPNVEFWSVKDQEAWFEKNYPDDLEDIAFAIPYKSVRRRNFGYLRALEMGSDLIITIDDDNLPNDDWLKDHKEAFTAGMNTVFSPNRLVNPCDMISCNHEPVYMRGYPISEIYQDEFVASEKNQSRVVLNMGLWTNKPDVDSYTNIMFPDLISTGKKPELDKRYALLNQHYIPINTQNTAFLREVTPAYYCLFQDTNILENRIDRFDDIWSGFILQHIAFQKGDTVSFGVPFTRHMRNVHDLNKDLKIEFSGIALNKLVFDAITSIKVSGTYAECYQQMADGLEEKLKDRVSPEADMFFKRMIRAMRIWNKLTAKWMK